MVPLEGSKAAETVCFCDGMPSRVQQTMFINDISTDIESEIRLFTDDCVCYRIIKERADFYFDTANYLFVCCILPPLLDEVLIPASYSLFLMSRLLCLC